jgi:hypothetical protein
MPEERARKEPLFCVDLLHQLMTAQLRVHDVDFSDLGVDCEMREREAVAPNR